MSTTLGKLGYIRDLDKYDTEKPFNLSFSKYTDGLVTNIEHEEHLVRLCDVRGRESEFHCESHSFRFMRLPTRHPIDGSEDTTFRYLEETRDFLREEFHAEKVICYDIRRRRSEDVGIVKPELGNRRFFGAVEDVAPPVYNVHIDHSLEGGFNRVRRHLTEEEAAEFLSPGWRVRIVNLWRPLNTVENAPLAVCDYNTLVVQDLLETDQVNESWYGEIFSVKFNAAQQFYWLSKQTAEEVCLMVMFDSHDGKPETGIRCCAHASVKLPESSAAPGRESVEVRAIIINKMVPDGTAPDAGVN